MDEEDRIALADMLKERREILTDMEGFAVRRENLIKRDYANIIKFLSPHKQTFVSFVEIDDEIEECSHRCLQVLLNELVCKGILESRDRVNTAEYRLSHRYAHYLYMKKKFGREVANDG